MRYPKLIETPTTREMVNVFGGYNHNIRIPEGDFYDMENLSSDDYPVLSPRKKRGIYHATGENDPYITGIISKDELCYVAGENFVIGSGATKATIAMGLDKETKKTLVSMGAYVIIMPDKKYINTVPNLRNEYEWGDIEKEYTTDPTLIENGNVVANTIQYAMCDADGNIFKRYEIGATEPTINITNKPEEIPLWIDTEGSPPMLKRYDVQSRTWVTVEKTYVRLSCKGIGEKFNVDDAVSFENAKGFTPKWDHSVITHRSVDSIVVEGFCDTGTYEHEVGVTPVTVSRKMPNLDLVIESGNRLWGCKYGTDINGNTVNEIYASKLGDFRNWYSFAGISTDSYAASVGTDGAFTGATTYMGRPIFFKENYMHIVYGDYPANYQIQTTACRGVQEGCSKSLAIVNEVLYYKSRTGICAYDGSLPFDVSTALGNTEYANAVGGAVANKYYISMEPVGRDLSVFVMFAYDTLKNIWHKEDSVMVSQFCNHKGELYFINADDNRIEAVLGSWMQSDAPIKWSAITGEIGTDSPDKKYISRMDVRMHVAVDAVASFYIEYDSSGEWEHLFTTPDKKLGTFAFPIKPKRCDHLRIKIVGQGTVKIYSICKTIEQGSDY